jgi:hypothetical protein
MKNILKSVMAIQIIIHPIGLFTVLLMGMSIVAHEPAGFETAPTLSGILFISIAGIGILAYLIGAVLNVYDLVASKFAPKPNKK